MPQNTMLFRHGLAHRGFRPSLYVDGRICDHPRL